MVKRGSIGLICKACGNHNLVDMRHKLCTYITSHPPQKVKKEQGGKSKKEQGGSSEEEGSANRGAVEGKDLSSIKSDDVSLKARLMP